MHQFDARAIGTLPDLLDTEDSKSRRIAFVSCADHKISPDMISFAGPSQCIVIQNLAATIPPESRRNDSTISSIQFAIEKRGAQDIIVCSHLCCRIIQHWMQMPNKHSAVVAVESFMKDAKNSVDRLYCYQSQHERMNLMVCEHTLFQLQNLHSHRFIRERIADGHLRLHGWVVDDATARVLAYDPSANEFVSIEKTIIA